MPTRDDIEAVYPLSSLQHGMLFHAAEGGETDVYFRLSEYELRGDLDIDYLEQAWRAVLERHTALRTAISRGTPPMQVVFRRAALKIERHDWRSLPAPEQERQLRNALAQERARGLDVAQAPMMRLAVFRVEDLRYRLIWAWHHVLLDGWSRTLALKEVGAYYAALAARRSLSLPRPRPYGDFIAWLQQQEIEPARDFWRRYLLGFRAPAPLPEHIGSAPSASQGRARAVRAESDTLATSLRAFAQRHRITPNTVLQAAWGIVLGRYASSDDVVFGATVAGRPADLDGADTMVGLFINTVPVRIRIARHEAIVPWLQRLQAEAAEANSYEWTPLVEIQGCSQVPAGRGLFDSIFVFENYPVDVFERTYAAGSRSTPGAGAFSCELLPGTDDVHYPLGVMVALSHSLRIEATFDDTRLAPATVERMLSHFSVALGGLIANDVRHAVDLPLATTSDRDMVMRWQPVQTAAAAAPLVPAGLAAQVEAMPDAIALVFEDKHVSYRELWRRSGRLGPYLVRCGLEREQCVALHLSRSPDLLVATIGVLRAGGTYVPLDPELPSERVRHILDDARIAILLTEDSLRGRLPIHGAFEICLDEAWEEIDREIDRLPDDRTDDSAAADVDPANLAYVIYTSGSTGVPKGVAVTHGGLANLARAQIARFKVTAGSPVLQYASWGFDAAASEWTTTLLAGGRLVLAPRERLLPGRDLADLMRNEQIDIVTLPPTTLARLDDADLHALRTVISAGEPCRGAWVGRWARHLRLLNAYGPTEGTVCATMTEPVHGDEAEGIGRPIDNVRVFILDRGGDLAPIGVPGELCIGGAGVCRGYIGQPALTAKRFVPDPFGDQPGARLYRTADVARWHADGHIDFLGRRDHQVKLRGYRIELEEIETVLALQPDIRQVAVDIRAGDTGDAELVAFVAATPGSAPLVDAWQQAMRRRLPDYMIPASFVLLDALPLTPNGKIDRASLLREPSPSSTSRTPGVVPRDNVEAHLMGLWQDILGRSDLDVDQDFFDVGGHSLRALALSERLSKTYGTRLAPDVVFRQRTIRTMASFLRREVALTLPSTIVPLQTRGTRPPLFCVHPAGGLVHGYLALSRQLGTDQPFYGIQSIGLNGGEPLSDLSRMAAHYLKDVIAVQHEGPYFIAGWSLGAAIAFEMARQLTLADRSVALVILIDGGIASMHDETRARLPETEAVAEAAREALTFQALTDLGIELAEWDEVPDGERVAYFLTRAQAAGRLPSDVTLAELEWLFHVIGHNVIARQRHRAQPYDGRVVLLRTALDERGDMYGVRPLVSGTFEEYEVPGDHTEIMREPLVATLAHRLRACMDEAILSVEATR